MAPRLEALCARKNAKLLRIDIDKWRSPVANQYDISKLPTLLYYKGDELITDNTRQVLSRLR